MLLTITAPLRQPRPTRHLEPGRLTELGAGDHTFQVRVTVDGATGTATAYGWTVINEPPAALGQVITTAENNADGEPVTLVAADSDALIYRIVDRPQHGYLEGTPPNLSYVPFADYYGPDSFTFEASDGQSVSNVATVHVTVRMGEFVVYADESAALGNQVTVTSGGVGVNQANTGAYLAHHAEPSIGVHVQMLDATSRVLADTIVITNRSTVYNPAFNDLDNKGTALGAAQTPIAVPYQPLPLLPGDITPGTGDLSVPKNGTVWVEPGAYGALTAGKDATVTLAGGLYHFQSWELGTGARILVQAPTEVRIAGRVLMGKDSHLGPDPTATAIDAGANDKSGTVKDGPATAFDAGSTIRAYVVSPNGTVMLDRDVRAVGGFLARWVDVRGEVQLSDLTP